VGLYVNTLPLVAPNVQKRPLDERLGEILSTLQEHGRYDHLPLADIQMFAERDEHEALMDTAVSIGGHGGDLSTPQRNKINRFLESIPMSPRFRLRRSMMLLISLKNSRKCATVLQIPSPLLRMAKRLHTVSWM